MRNRATDNEEHHGRGRLGGVLILGSAVAMTTACVLIPLPRVTPQVGPKRIQQVLVGTTTKDELRALLKKPTVELTDDLWVYQWFTRKFNLAVGIPGGGTVAPVGVRSYRALVAFGPDGRVARFELYQRPPGPERPAQPVAEPSRITELPWKRPGWVCFAAGSGGIVAGCGHCGVCSWDVDTPESPVRRETPNCISGRVACPALTGEFAVTGSKGTVLLRTAEGAWETLRPSGRGNILGLAISRDGTLLATSQKRSIRVFDLSSGNEIGAWESPEPVVTLALSPTGATLAACGRGRVRLFDVPTGSPEGSVEAGCRSSFAFSPDGTRITVNGISHVAVYSVDDVRRAPGVVEPRQVVLLPFGSGKSSCPTPSSCVGWPVAFSPSGRRIAAVTERGVVVVGLPSGSILGNFPHMDAFFRGVTFRGEDKLVTVSDSGLLAWQVSTE